MKGNPGVLLTFSYWMGFINGIAMLLAIQDFLSVGNITSQSVGWAFVVLVSSLAHVWLRSKLNQKSKEIEEEER